MFHPDIYDLSRRIIESYTAAKKKIVTAESCTGGLVGAALTQIPGSSEVLERGFVSYSNDSKIELLGVPPDILADYGAVSAQVSEAMAQGALEFSRADIAVSITGVAGPGGGTANKPIGLVYIGLANRDGAVFHYRNEFKGDRDDIRAQAMQEALNLLLSMINKDPMDKF